METKTVSAIIPVYNEEKTVAKVIEALLNSGLVSEIICINDGSVDDSLKVLRNFEDEIKVINFKKNRGKGTAVAEGIKRARGEYLLFCDSDLINFTSEHVRTMLKPVLEGEAKAVFAVPTKDKSGRTYNPIEVYLAGERVYPRNALLPCLEKLKRTKGAGGSEVVMNTLFSKKEIKIVSLIGLVKPRKDHKWNSVTAIKQYFLSAAGVLQEIARIEINSAPDLKKLENLLQVDTFESLFLRIREMSRFLSASEMSRFLSASEMSRFLSASGMSRFLSASGIKNKRVKMFFKRYFAKYLAKYFGKIKI